MTKRNRYSLLILLGSFLVLGILYYLRKIPQESLKTDSPETPLSTPAPKIDPETLKIDGRRVIGLPPAQASEKIKTLKIANKAGPEWKLVLEKTIRKQGGDAVKDLKLEVMDSFVWTEDNIALYVESVRVSIRNDKDFQTTFRVLVDSQTGKILKNWDQPVIDPANPRESFRLKLDPRYHQDP